jgi:3-oxoacyl-[acyl-carrier protein] reductase
VTLQGRVALVTGGGRGIGRAISEDLAAHGAIVAVNYRRDQDAAEDTVATIRAAGGQAHAFAGSVDDFEAASTMVDAIVASLGPIEILVNNAGIASRGNDVASTDPAEMSRVVATHAFGAFYLSKVVLPSMRTRPRGDIVMISSVSSRFLAPNAAPYNMGKAAMEALALTLAKEERKNNIHVNIVAPGLVDTDMGARLARATRGVGDIHQLDQSSGFGHVCTPAEVASVVRFFVSADASYVTGQRVYVDAGNDSPF